MISQRRARFVSLSLSLHGICTYFLFTRRDGSERSLKRAKFGPLVESRTGCRLETRNKRAKQRGGRRYANTMPWILLRNQCDRLISEEPATPPSPVPRAPSSSSSLKPVWHFSCPPLSRRFSFIPALAGSFQYDSYRRVHSPEKQAVLMLLTVHFTGNPDITKRLKRFLGKMSSRSPYRRAYISSVIAATILFE